MPKVLVADDNPDVVESLSILLTMSGHQVATAIDGQDAVEKADAFHPEVIILDIGMPRLDGYQACKAIREASSGSNIVIAALTGYNTDEYRRRGKEAGFDFYYQKPMDLGALKELKLV